MFEGFLDAGFCPGCISPYWDWYSILPTELYFKFEWLIADDMPKPTLIFLAISETRFKGSSSATSSTTMVGNLIETSQIVRLLLEIRYPQTIVRSITKYPNHGHEGRLARAILAHEQRQRCQTSDLLFAEAAEVL